MSYNQKRFSSSGHYKSFEVVPPSRFKTMALVVLVVAAVAAATWAWFSFRAGPSVETVSAPPLAAPSPSPAPPTQPQQEVQAAPEALVDPANDPRVQQLKFFIANPSMDDAVFTVEWLAKKYNQPPESVITDLKVIVDLLNSKSDEELVTFFNGPSNPWADDPDFPTIIRYVSHRDYVGYVGKCADIYSQNKLGQSSK